MNSTTAVALLTVLASGIFGLLGVIVGVVGTTGTQIFLDWKRGRREGDRAKQLVAGELLHIELLMRSISIARGWPSHADADEFLPTSAWRENRTRLAGRIDGDLWERLVRAYAILELDRARY